MGSDELESSVHQCVRQLYERRRQRPSAFRLRQALAETNWHLLRAAAVGSAWRIVERLLEAHVSSGEATLFDDVMAKALAAADDAIDEGSAGSAALQDSQLMVMEAAATCPAEYRMRYDTEWNMAFNRFVREFLNDFSLPDGSIDWDRLIRFNSGQE